ncbi:hypothetical protein EUGRSUZ_L03210 [Eucalyptus grandis]|uniref:UDP-glycosyltransferases domain-containing protein n=1 Tax=Eucalyptus grandis TaxID=71139 RepID=A0AAD9T8P6_EUCGR|nr:hypothetical protein EUGRSUZ_L03210 [Eucalyptus grandis]
MLWVQSCACFAAYYHCYHGLVPFPSESTMEIDVQLPCMPLLKHDEVPARGEGPNANVRADFMKADDCVGWLDSKPAGSVVYVSFGSVVYLKQDQWDEIAYGLLNSGVNFLWVMKPPHKDSGYTVLTLPEGFLEKAGDKGKVVQWSPQEQVLAHPAVTDTKYLVDVFKVGVRMWRGEAEDKLITRDVVEKCLLEATVGEKAAEMKRNALKWKAAAEAAVAEGGSSDRNIQAFVDEVKRRSVELDGK